MNHRSSNRTSAALATSLVFAGLFVQTHAFGRPFEKGPYVQALAPRSVDIRFEVYPPATATVEVRQPGKPPIHVADAETKAFHSVTVEGLSPSTHYEYVVRTLGFNSTEGSFTTAPPFESSAPFSFVVFGDDRSDEENHLSVVRAVEASPFDFLVHTGDFVPNGGDEQAWKNFFGIERFLLRDHSLFACIGNHELVDDRAGSAFARYFGVTPKTGEQAQLFSTMRWANSRFFFLNPFQQDLVEGTEHSWLENELKKADTEPGLMWRFIVAHQGLYSSGRHGNNERLIAAGFPQLFKDHKIDLVIAGHDHIYERGNEKGLRYLVSGGGGAPLYNIEHRVAGAKKIERAFHFIQFEVTPEGVHLTTKTPTGSVIDSCNFNKMPGWLCDPAEPPPVMKPAPKESAPPPKSDSPFSRFSCALSASGREGGAGGTWLFAAALVSILRKRSRRS